MLSHAGSPVNLSRLRFDPASGILVYQPKAGRDVDAAELSDPLEFVARVLIHLPEPNKHLARFYGAYANRIRSALLDDDPTASGPRRLHHDAPSTSDGPELIHRIYESSASGSPRKNEMLRGCFEGPPTANVDPLTCTRCGDTMKVLAFITEPKVIRAILEHRDDDRARQRAPPTREPISVH